MKFLTEGERRTRIISLLAEAYIEYGRKRGLIEIDTANENLLEDDNDDILLR